MVWKQPTTPVSEDPTEQYITITQFSAISAHITTGRSVCTAFMVNNRLGLTASKPHAGSLLLQSDVSGIHTYFALNYRVKIHFLPIYNE